MNECCQNKANCSVLHLFFSFRVYANIRCFFFLVRRRHEPDWSGFGPVVVVYLRHARIDRHRHRRRK
jgi:hypothetical protein